MRIRVPEPVVERGDAEVEVSLDSFSREACVFLQSRSGFLSHMLGLCWHRDREVMTGAQNMVVEGAGLYQDLAEDVWVVDLP